MARRDPRFPAINAVAAELRRRAKHLEWPDKPDPDGDFCDVRLQVRHAADKPRVMAHWAVYVGPSDYDPDHRGFWGAGCIPKGPFNSRALAADLIDQARQQEMSFHHFTAVVCSHGGADAD